MKKPFLLILIFCSACGDKTKPLEIENTNQAQSVMDSDTASDNKNSLAVKKKPDPSTLALQELANSVNCRLIVNPGELSATKNLKEFVPLQLSSNETKIVRAFEITFRRYPDESFSDRKLGPFRMVIQPKQSVQVNIFDSKIIKEFELYSDDSQFQVTKIYYSDGTVRNYGFITKLKL